MACMACIVCIVCMMVGGIVGGVGTSAWRSDAVERGRGLVLSQRASVEGLGSACDSTVAVLDPSGALLATVSVRTPGACRPVGSSRPWGVELCYPRGRPEDAGLGCSRFTHPEAVKWMVAGWSVFGVGALPIVCFLLLICVVIVIGVVAAALDAFAIAGDPALVRVAPAGDSCSELTGVVVVKAAGV